MLGSVLLSLVTTKPGTVSTPRVPISTGNSLQPFTGQLCKGDRPTSTLSLGLQHKVARSSEGFSNGPVPFFTLTGGRRWSLECRLTGQPRFCCSMHSGMAGWGWGFVGGTHNRGDHRKCHQARHSNLEVTPNSLAALDIEQAL